MARIDELFADYAAHHRDWRNQATHYVGIPTIAFALLGLAWKLALPSPAALSRLNLGLAVALALTLAYLRWHRGLALGTGLLLAALGLAGSQLPAIWLWPMLGVGVGLQYVGHYLFEGHAPAFHRNLVHTLVGPLWVAARLFRALGLYRGG